VDRAGLRLKLLAQQAAAEDLVLLFGDESEALTHPYLAHAWFPKGATFRIEAPGKAERRAILGAMEPATGRLTAVVSRTKASGDFIALLAALDRACGPKPGAPAPPVVLVLDNGSIHKSKASLAELAKRQSWLTVEWLPGYCPELNAIERTWLHLKRRHLANRTFDGGTDLERQIHAAITAWNRDHARSDQHLTKAA
jgi:transposase